MFNCEIIKKIIDQKREKISLIKHNLLPNQLC